MQAGDRLYLIDGSGFIFRAYHALPPLTRGSDSLPVGAVSGFCNIMFKLTEELKAEEKPTHIAVIFDAGSKTFRNDIYPEYKANRPPPPEDLIPQFPLCRDATRAFSVLPVELPGYEADDIIAAYAERAEAVGASVRIYSSDKDLTQLLTDKIRIVDPLKNKEVDEAVVLEKFGVTPDKVIQVQALAGDSTDNIPGVPGIGVKTAAELINLYGDVETLLSRAGEIKQNKRRENLIAFADKARISLELVTLKKDVPDLPKFDEMRFTEPDFQTMSSFAKLMEFNTLLKRIGKKFDVSPAEIEVKKGEQQSLFSDASLRAAQKVTETRAVKAPVANADDTPSGDFDYDAYEVITDEAALQNWINLIKEKGLVAFDTETTGLDPLRDELVGICLALAPNKACYIPLVTHGGSVEPLAKETVIAALKPVLEADYILKIGQNIKFDIRVMQKTGVNLVCYDDTMLMSAVLNAGKHNHGMDALAAAYLGHTPIAFEEITGKGRDKITFDKAPIDKAKNYAAEDADVTLRLYRLFKSEIFKQKFNNVYETIERALPAIVADMENNGIAIDAAALTLLSAELEKKSAELQAQIYEIAGCEFNIASPKQLGEVLTEKMTFPLPAKLKKTAGGQLATGADILEELAASGHPLPEPVLEWRQYQKLKSTYADALVAHVNPETKRAHTAFHLTGAVTGRFSSSDPNLQNIPIRTEEGRLIRKAFVAPEGNRLVAADYSQIELRILSVISDCKILREAFKDGADIHARTAAEIFNTPLAEPDSALRRKAKAVNFGIIYGISAFGLARQLKIPQSEAGEYIDRYFARLPEIRDYMEATKKFARENGYVQTPFGRRIHVKEINSGKYNLRAFAERAAINAPIQGGAADIIKLAMIKTDRYLKETAPYAKLLLQVHDELVFETPADKADSFAADIKKIMETAILNRSDAPDIPLVVDVGIGDNWEET